MSELGDTYRAMRDEKQKRHRKNNAQNLAILHKHMAGRYVVTNEGETVLFREKGKVWVDFYPSTGRWRMVGANVKKKWCMRGGACAFIKWYERTK